MSGAAEVTVKHNLGAQTQNSLAEHTYVTTKKIRQVVSTLPASASFPASFLIQQNNSFFIAGAAGAGASGA